MKTEHDSVRRTVSESVCCSSLARACVEARAWVKRTCFGRGSPLRTWLSRCSVRLARHGIAMTGVLASSRAVLGLASAAAAIAAACYVLRWRHERRRRSNVFIFVDNVVHNRPPYLEYVRAVVPTLAQFGGRYLTRQGECSVVSDCGDSNWAFETTVLLEFPSLAHARRWVDDTSTMAPLHAARKRHATSRMLIIEGVRGAWERAHSLIGSAYVLMDDAVHTPEAYAEYVDGVAPIVAELGGRYLSRGGAVDGGGDWPWSQVVFPSVADSWDGFIVLLEFPSVAVARAWADPSGAVGPWHAKRCASATSRMVVLEKGYAP